MQWAVKSRAVACVCVSKCACAQCVCACICEHAPVAASQPAPLRAVPGADLDPPGDHPPARPLHTRWLRAVPLALGVLAPCPTPPPLLAASDRRDSG